MKRWIALTSVALTTIAQDTAALAASALDLAVRRVENSSDGPMPREIVVPPRLVVRQTTAPPGRH